MDATPRDYGREAHEAAEKHLAACWDAFDAESEGEDDPPWPPNMAGPFDGPTGRGAVLADPQGAHFSVSTAPGPH